MYSTSFVRIHRFVSILILGIALFGIPALNAQEEGAEGATSSEEAPIEAEIDWFAQLVKGGNVAIALILVSFAGFVFFLERLLVLRKKRFIPDDLLQQVQKSWANYDFESVIKKTKDDKSIYSEVANYIARHTHTSFEIVSFSASDIVSRRINRQHFKNYPLAIVATVSPLLGLLGTIIGMIEAFQKVAIMGDTGDASVLADSISKALITTAIGLIIAIPALSAYHFFKMRINNLSLRIEEEVDKMLAVWLSQ